MNTNNLNDIFSNYIKKFDDITYGHEEIYKWEIIHEFKNLMDEALAASSEEFPAKLLGVKKLTENIIDSYTTPFYGLVKLSEKEPEAVKNMFKSLYTDDGGDINIKQQHIRDFLISSHELRSRSDTPDSFLYKNDMHSVTAYLFLYDPDHNYMYKATEARAFADCIEFYDDWGSGDNLKLDVYYRMCDQLVEAIKTNEELLNADMRRFNNDPGKEHKPLYPDPEKHVLAFDLIFGCRNYNLFDGIDFDRPKSKERQIIKEMKEKAIELYENYLIAKEKYDLLQEAEVYLNTTFAAGQKLKHKNLGEGTVLENNGNTITVEFREKGQKKFGTITAAIIGMIESETEGYGEKIEKYKDILNNGNKIKSIYNYAEKAMNEYSEYLD